MLLIHFLQLWINLEDPAVEDSLYDSVAMRTLAGIDLGVESAPDSTKSNDGERDPEMHQTAKDKQWYCGMKAHIGVDSQTELVHTILVSAANVHDREALP